MGGKEGYGENSSIHQSHFQNASGNWRGVTGGACELVCLCGKEGTCRECDGSAHSSQWVVNSMPAF